MNGGEISGRVKVAFFSESWKKRDPCPRPNVWALTRGTATDRRGGGRAVGFNALLGGIRFGAANDAS
jgi:hypothetical protein